MKRTRKKRWLVLLAAGALLALLAAVAGSVVAARARHAARLVALKGTWMTLWDYEKEHQGFPLEYGEFRKCSFVDPAYREAPELAGLYYCGLSEHGDPVIPLVVEAVEPQPAIDRLLGRKRQIWIQFADGHSESFELASDAVGLPPVLEALLREKNYPAELEAKIRQRFAELGNKLEKPRLRR